MENRHLFSWWQWLGAPIFIGSCLIAFATHLYLGLAWSVVFVLWYWDSGETTCSRCSSYGTFRCGVQGKIIPWFWKKRTMASVSSGRIRLHYYIDVAMLVLTNAVYCLEPLWLPAAMIWTLGLWLIAFRSKKFHGLLFRLKTKEPAQRMLLSLPVVATAEDASPAASVGQPDASKVPL